jgi:hypothetical protein
MNQYQQSQLKQIAIDACRRISKALEGTEYFAKPFQHIVLDNFLPLELASQCLKSFPPTEDESWICTNDPEIEIKCRSNWNSEFDVPDGIVEAVRILNSSVFLKSVSQRLCIEKLMPDPYFTGGGLNLSISGGLLDVHVDGNYHDASGLNRRVNAILYLNPDWIPEYRGEFGLYDISGLVLVKKIAPLFNRLVVFDSHDFSFHGLPDPIEFPENNPRRSIILYYYTKAPRPDDQISVSEPHSALWVKKSKLDKKGRQTREFM